MWGEKEVFKVQSDAHFLTQLLNVSLQVTDVVDDSLQLYYLQTFQAKPHYCHQQRPNEIISYYNFNRSNVYTALLDATKAFDRVNYCKLFRKLLYRHMSPLVLRLLLYMYTNEVPAGQMGKSH